MRNARVCGFVVFLTFTAFPSVAMADNWYVATTGNDANPGTEAQPFQHIANAYNHVLCGDTLYIRGGTYTSGLGIAYGVTSFCFSWASPTTVRNYPGETVIINTSVSLENNVIGGASTIFPAHQNVYLVIEADVQGAIKVDATYGSGVGHGCFGGLAIDYVRLINLECYGSDRDGGTIDSAYWEFVSMNVHNNCHHGLYLTIGHVTVTGGRYHHNGTGSCADGYRGYGIQVYDAVNLHNDDNLINGAEVDNNGYGIVLSSGARDIVMNTLIHDNINQQLVVYSSMSNAQIYGNTITRSPGFGIYIISAHDTTLRNNIVFGNAGGPFEDTGTNTINTNNFTSDPLFTCPGTSGGCDNDYTLQSISGAISYGTNLSGTGIPGVTLDINGNTRKNPPDAGAYEFGGSVSPTIASVTPVSLVQGATAQNLAIVGASTNFSGSSVTSIPCSGVTVNSTTFTDLLHVTANVTVSAMATVASCTVTVTTGAEVASRSNGFSVTAAATPALSSITPAIGAQASTLDVAVIGTATHFSNGVTVCALSAPTTGIVFNSVTVSDTTHLSANISIGPDAGAGVRDFSCTTSAETATAMNGFTITASTFCANFPGTIGIVTGQCSSIRNDTSGSATIVIPTLPSSVTVSASHYIIVITAAVKSADGMATFDLPVSSIADTLGNTYSFCKSGPTNLAIQQEIWAAPVAFAGSATVTVTYPTLTYSGTGHSAEAYGFATSSPCDASGSATGMSNAPSISTSGATTVNGSLILAAVVTGSAEIITPTTYTAIEQLQGDTYATMVANIGVQTAAFTQPSSTFWTGVILAFKPNVATPPSISVVDPATGQQFTSDMAIDLTGLNTHWDGTTVFNFGNMGGITLLSTDVHSATSATVHIRISYGATAGVRDVLMITGTEVANAPSAFTITAVEVETLMNGFTVTAPSAGTGPGARILLRIR